jgi:hypothetical protein
MKYALLILCMQNSYYDKINYGGYMISRTIRFTYDTSFGESFVKINLSDQKYDYKKYYCDVQLEYFSLNSGLEQKKLELEIDYEYFENLYNKLINIKIENIFKEDDLIYLDGSKLDIYFSNGSKDINLSISCHNSDIEKRNLTEINQIFDELIEKLNIDKKLILD